MRFVIDVDGTVLTQQKPGEYEKCAPLPGAAAFVSKLFDAGHQVVFYTSRNFKYMRQTHEQLRAFGFKYHHLELGKPHGDVIIDDRAIKFTSWTDVGKTIEQLLADRGEAASKAQYDDEPPRPDASEPESARLARLSAKHSYLEDFNETLSRYRMKRLDQLGCAGESALELGCGEGLLTRYLSTVFRHVDAVDGSAMYIERAKALVSGNVTFHQSLIEEFEPARGFDCIVAGGLLEHLADPGLVLNKTKKWLAPGGRLIVFVPNAVSLNRRLGKAMRLIEDCYELTESDLKIGHRRAYDLASLRLELEGAGYDVVDMGGLFLKPLANAQMVGWDAGILDGLNILGDELPDLCTEIFAVGALRESK